MELRKYGYEELYQLYVVQKLSLSKIVKLTGCNWGALRDKLHRLGIPVREKHKVYPDGDKYRITKEALEKEYIENGKTYKEIASQFGCGETLIYNRMRKYGIQPRRRSEILKGRKFNITHRERLSEAKQGKWNKEENPKWKGGVSIDHTRIRRIKEYNAFRRRVLRAKGNLCALCGRNLDERCPHCGHRPDKHVHHAREFSNHESERFSLENAIVLCESCHLNYHGKDTP